MSPTNTKEKFHRSKRNSHHFKSVRQTKLRDRASVGNILTKSVLKCSLLNVNGLNEASLSNIESIINTNRPDVIFLLETKRRIEENGLDITVPGYSVHEARRSNNAGDRDGGGIAVYTRLGDGILFKQHTPDITDQANAYVNSERVWITVESQSCKTAICGLYLGCQYSDDRYGTWNDTIYQVVQQEAFNLRLKGFRIIYLGDFNAHIDW